MQLSFEGHSPATVAEAAYATFALLEAVDNNKARGLDRTDHQLSDPVPSAHLVSAGGISIDEDHCDLASVTRVYQSRRVQARDAMAGRKPTA
jgi:hypothetical protein